MMRKRMFKNIGYSPMKLEEAREITRENNNIPFVPSPYLRHKIRVAKNLIKRHA